EAAIEALDEAVQALEAAKKRTVRFRLLRDLRFGLDFETALRLAPASDGSKPAPRLRDFHGMS
uniref:hypothetical protein n=1 Tax=Acidimangrovimonas sediminis TaxID=2056283 RepID=UPI001E5E1150